MRYVEFGLILWNRRVIIHWTLIAFSASRWLRLKTVTTGNEWTTTTTTRQKVVNYNWLRAVESSTNYIITINKPYMTRTCESYLTVKVAYEVLSWKWNWCRKKRRSNTREYEIIIERYWNTKMRLLIFMKEDCKMTKCNSCTFVRSKRKRNSEWNDNKLFLCFSSE